MSASSRPSDRVRRSSAGATTDPAKPTPESEPIPPPSIAVDELEGEPVPWEQDSEEAVALDGPCLQRPPRGRRLAQKPDEPRTPLTAEQRLLLLDTWRRSGLPAGDFAALVGGISKHTLYSWKKKFETEGPAGLADKPRGGPTGSRLPEVTKRAILMLKQDNPDWGCEKISAMATSSGTT